MLEERGGGAVEERVARELGLADEADELHVHQRLDVRGDVHAADLLDLALGERLAVGDDRERLQRGAAEAAGTVHLQHRADVAAAARLGLQAVGAAGADEAEAGAADLQRLLEPAERLVDLLRGAGAVDVHELGVLALLAVDGAHGFAQLGGGKRRLAREEQRADNLLQGVRQGDLDFFTHSRRAFQAVCRPAPRGRPGW